MMPTFTSVVQFCKSELLRVPQMFTTVTTAIITTAALVDARGDKGMISAR